MQTYTWSSASGRDVPEMVQMAEDLYQMEIDEIFVPDPIAYSRNLTQAVVTQFYNPAGELVRVARDDSGAMIAYVWVIRGQRSPWSDQEMVMPRMVHVDLTCSARLRVSLLRDMIYTWEAWAHSIQVPIICSTTMRRETDAFLRLHERAGYDIRGSFCYKKLNTTPAGLPIP
jgi:hypothetical protein